MPAVLLARLRLAVKRAGNACGHASLLLEEGGRDRYAEWIVIFSAGEVSACEVVRAKIGSDAHMCAIAARRLLAERSAFAMCPLVLAAPDVPDVVIR